MLLGSGTMYDKPILHSKSGAIHWADTMDQRMGDCLGKGAFGAVYRALNPGTGETVAVKQIKLADLPKSELRVIMVCHVAILAE